MSIFVFTAGRVTPRLDASFFGCRGHKIALKTQYSSHKYIQALGDRRFVNVNGASTDAGIVFEVEDYGVNATTKARVIALKSIYKNYLSASECKNPTNPSNPECNVSAHSSYVWNGAKFQVKHNKNNQYWFQTHWTHKDDSGKDIHLYLMPHTDGYLRGDGDQYDLRRWAKFTPECV